jgi:4-aminobutyrate aminotransferase-like enzyme
MPDGSGPAPAVARRLVDRLRDGGVLVGLTGRSDSTMKIRPPLAFTTEHADRLVRELTAALPDVLNG